MAVTVHYDKIVDARQFYGLTQAQLAKKVGISKSALSDYERLLRMPTLEVFIKMLNILNIHVDEVIR
jgi:transcriptional regulator with XRE-family HTH domain